MEPSLLNTKVKTGDVIRIETKSGETVEIFVNAFNGKRCSLAINATKDIKIKREESKRGPSEKAT